MFYIPLNEQCMKFFLKKIKNYYTENFCYSLDNVFVSLRNRIKLQTMNGLIELFRRKLIVENVIVRDMQTQKNRNTSKTRGMM